ncbi:MAG: hypothetical protein SFX72_00210 [Isosphaeraceae bacterium]|nr:hypothetical protein [Isosphaeraceae bacterium]
MAENYRCSKCGWSGGTPRTSASPGLECPRCGSKSIGTRGSKEQGRIPEDVYGFDDQKTIADEPSIPVEPPTRRSTGSRTTAASAAKSARSGSNWKRTIQGAFIGLGLAVVGVVGSNLVNPPPRRAVTAEQKGKLYGALAANLVLLVGGPIAGAIYYRKKGR